jgi:hypothetical protein
MTTDFQITVGGVDVQVDVHHYLNVPADSRADNQWDYEGYVEFEFSCTDLETDQEMSDEFCDEHYDTILAAYGEILVDDYNELELSKHGL